MPPDAFPKEHRVKIDASPLADGAAVDVHIREGGAGPALVLLHGGWGYGAYPFPILGAFRVLAPDRSGYGRSTPVEEQPLDFHARAAAETRLMLDALGIEHALLWGHSDGAVIAAHLALADPERHPSVVLESLHLWRRKPGSRRFFETAATTPERAVGRLSSALEADHGARWRDVVRMNGRAWVRLADESDDDRHDLFDGCLASLRSRVLLLHGARDPRTEPGELDAVRAALPHAQAHVLSDVGHAPHVEAPDEAARLVASFLRNERGRP